MAPFFRRAFVVTFSVACVLWATSCSQKPRPLPPGIVVVAVVPGKLHNRYLVLWGNKAKHLRYGLIADEHLKHVFHTNRRGQLLDQRNRVVGIPPCGNPQKLSNFDNEAYAVSNDGRMIYCVSGAGAGGPLKSMRVGDSSSLRTSPIQFWDNGAGSISFLSERAIALLVPDQSCIKSSRGGFATRLVIYNPTLNRISRNLRCTDGIVPYRNGFVLVRRVEEGGNLWHYSLDMNAWRSGEAQGVATDGEILFTDHYNALRLSGNPREVLAHGVPYAELFDSNSVANLLPLFRHRRATDDQIKR